LIAERVEQGGLSVERMCQLSGVSRAGFYRHWEASAPRQADTALRDAIQQVIVAKRFYGYRRVQPELRQRGLPVNAKRVLRLMREDNLLGLRRGCGHRERCEWQPCDSAGQARGLFGRNQGWRKGYGKS
jgi:hypothetical protein